MFDNFDNTFPEKPQLKHKKKSGNSSKYFVVIALLFLLFSNVTATNYWIILTFIGAVAFHEFGHFIGMRLFKYQEPNFMFYAWMADKAQRHLKPISQRHKIFTLQLGSTPGIIIGIILFMVALNSGSEAFLWLSMIFIGVNMFSLLPIDPLDGGNIIRNLFFPKQQKPYLYFVLLSSLVVILIGFYTGFYMVMILGFLMGIKVRTIQKNMLIYDALESENIDYNKSYKNLSNREYWRIRSVFLDFNPKLESIIPSRFELWENEALLTNQIKQLLKADIKLDASPTVKIVSFTLYLACLLVPFYLLMSHYEEIIQILEKVNLNV
ncbi:MAG: hypothetical protein R3279_05500 [Putridiphycobacter sp.]|nr:hypothetical protein [Putridiphycobacter sp.]